LWQPLPQVFEERRKVASIKGEAAAQGKGVDFFFFPENPG
jgi:hypothetical protein